MSSLGALVFGIVGLTASDPITEEDVIIVSGMRPVGVEDVTSAVSVLDARALDILDTPYLVDQLRAVPGTGVSRSGSFGALSQVRLRGGEANHTLVLLDGIEVSDPMTGETDFGLLAGMIPERIEVLRGEQSGLYGSDAVGGVVSITSAMDRNSAALEIGSAGSGRIVGSTSWPRDNSAVSVSGSAVSTEGVDTSGRSGEADGSENFAGLVTARHTFANGVVLTGLARYSATEIEIDSDIDFDGVLDDVDRTTDAVHLTAGATVAGSTGALDHLVRWGINSVRREDFADGSFSQQTEGLRTQLTYSPSVALAPAFAEELRFSGVVAYEKEEYAARDAIFGGLTNLDADFETLGLAAEMRLDLGRVDIVAGGRHDDNNGRFDDAMTGRLAIGADIGRTGRWFVALASGVKNPTYTELFGFFPGSFVGNSSLVPESSQSVEVGWRLQAQDVSASVSYFAARLDDEIVTVFNSDFTTSVANRPGTSERQGMEISADWRATPGLSLSAQTTIVDSRGEDGSREVRVPGETASISFAYRPLSEERWKIGGALDFVGSQEDFDFSAFPTRKVTLDPYVLATLTADRPISGDLRATFRLTNALDQDTVDVFGYHAPGIEAFVGLRWRP